MSIRQVALASVVAMIVTSFGANAAPLVSSVTAAGARQGPALQLATDNTEFGARKRHRAYRGNAAAGAAMMGMMIGTIGAVVAAERRRDAYERSYYAPYGYGHGYHHSYGHAQSYGYARPRAYRHPSTLPAGPLYPEQYRQPRIGW